MNLGGMAKFDRGIGRHRRELEHTPYGGAAG